MDMVHKIIHRMD